LPSLANNLTNKTAVRELRGCEALVSALRTHSDQRDVVNNSALDCTVCCSCHVLYFVRFFHFIPFSFSVAQNNCPANRNVILRAGALPLVQAAQQRFPYLTEVPKCLSALS
jgi:hypothetical protein